MTDHEQTQAEPKIGSLAYDLDRIGEALANVEHSPICEFGECVVCDALDALARVRSERG